MAIRLGSLTKRAAEVASAIFFRLARSQAWVLTSNGGSIKGGGQLLGAIAGQRVGPDGFGGVKRQSEYGYHHRPDQLCHARPQISQRLVWGQNGFAQGSSVLSGC